MVVGIILAFFGETVFGQEIAITEILYNPHGNDNNQEFVEVFLSEPFSLEGYMFGDIASNDTLTLLKYVNDSSYAVIVEDGFSLERIALINASFYHTGSTLGNNLNNDKDAVFLFTPLASGGMLLANVMYGDGQILALEGFSLERNVSGYFQSALEGGTPGEENSVIHSIVHDVVVVEDEGELSFELEVNGREITVTNGTDDDIEFVKNTTLKDEDDEDDKEEKDNDILKNENAMFSLATTLPKEVYTNITYRNLFSVRNKQYVRGSNATVDVLLNYSLVKVPLEGDDISDLSITTVVLDGIKSSRRVGTGELIVQDAGVYTLCGTVSNAGLTDNTNNTMGSLGSYLTVCGNFSFQSAKDVLCDITLEMVPEKMVYSSDEKVSFVPKVNDQRFPLTLRYWVTDLFNTTLQKPKITQRFTKKTYTHDLEQRVDVFVLHGELEEVPCTEVNISNNAASTLVIVKSDASFKNEITIGELSEDLHFGDSLKVPLQIIVGNKTRAQIKVYIESGSGRKITPVSSVKMGNLGRFTVTPSLEIPENCERKYLDGTYAVVAEWAGKQTQKKITIKHSLEGCTSRQQAQKSVYEIIDFAERVSVNQSFSTGVYLRNADASWHNYSLWSYVYRGPKSYSGYRVGNVQSIMMKPGDETTVALWNTVEEAEAGEYKFKVHIQKDDQKTTTSIVKDIGVVGVTTVDELSLKKERITSFYTRARSAAKTITLYGAVQGSGNYTVSLETLKEKRVKPLEVAEYNKTAFSVELFPGKNIYILRLLKDGSVVDTRDLVLFNDGDSLHSDEGVSSLTGLTELTGAAVAEPLYRSTQAKIHQHIPLLLGVTILCSLGFLIPGLRRRLKKNI